MKTISVSELRYTDISFEIEDIFPENWSVKKEFSLYKTKERPCSALFFVCSDIEACFFAEKSSAVTARRGDIMFIPKGAKYHVRCSGISEKIDTYTINFHLLNENGDEALLSESISVLTSRQDNLITPHLKNLFDTFYRTERVGDRAVRNRAKINGEFFLLLNLISESASQRSDYYYPIRRGVEAFSEEWNLNEKIEKYAELCNMSVTYFYRCFRKWSGRSPIEYRNALRISNAESMLRCTDMKIGEISDTVGFEDPFYFCRTFSKEYGVSPQKYRKALRSED